MPLQRARLTGPWGIGLDIQREAQTVGLGCVRYFEREIEGQKETVMIVNRTEGFKILVLKSDGGITTLYGGEENGK